MKKVAPIFIVIVVVFGYLFFSKKLSSPPQQIENQRQAEKTEESSSNIPTETVVDYRASFAIFTNGVFRVFTAAMYHNLSADVFIQSDNPNIVHVKKSGITWDDFFKTLPFKLTRDCLTTGTKETFCTNNNGELRFYLNAEKDPDALDKQINNGDKLLVSYGNEDEKQIQNQLQQIRL